PNSPSGTAVGLEAIEALARSVDGLLVVDEAYVDFGATSALPLVRRLDNIIVLRTFSKSFSLAGMRVGLALGPVPLIAELLKVKDSYNVSRTGIAAAAAALDDYAWMTANVERVCRTRTRLIEALRGRGFAVPESQTNFVLARKPGVSLEPLYRQ